LGSNQGQAIAIRQVQQWLQVVGEGDIIMFYCESAKIEKQMKVWKKWILRHNPDLLHSIDEETKSFYIYKPMSLE
jgi:arabinogalactan endo-1,4-beta-galactosidase